MNALRSWSRDHALAMAVIGVVLAIAGTTALDAVGFGINVLPLVLLFFLFWYLQRLSRVEIGLTWGLWTDYGLALLYPALVLALIGLIAWLAHAATFHSINWTNTLLNLFFQALTTAVGAIITEEGIFRGWLWATLQRARVTELWVLVLTSAAFAAWHISTALLPTPFHPALAQVPVYILNAGVIGFNWGLMRRRSGSIVVSSVSHGVWNSLVYVLFGFGTTLGVLGIHNTAVFGPEIGLVGLALNVAFAVVLWVGLSRARDAAPTRRSVEQA